MSKEENTEPQEAPVDPKDQQIAELTDTLKRLQAEFENFKKRSELEVERKIKFGHQQVISKLLPTMDDFQRAVEHKDAEGYKHIFANLKQLLADEQVEQMESLHQTFNPSFHEALMVHPTQNKEEDNTIVEVFVEGYTIGEAVLRHAKVKVAKYEETKGDE